MNTTTLLCITLLFILNLTRVKCLKCYTCSTKSGDTFCGEDTFDGSKLPTITCPPDADVCVRIRQEKDGSIFRSCGTSSAAKLPEKTHFGFYPLKDRCNKYKSVKEAPFPNVEFEICSCSQDLSNNKGIMKCNSTLNLSRRIKFNY